MTAWREWVAEEARTIASAGRWRTVDSGPPDRFGAGSGVALGDSNRPPMVSFASNDYLGLSKHPAVVAAAAEALARWGTGAGASRLAGGGRPIHAELEAAVAAWKHAEAALLFPTGYAANLGLLATLAGPDVRVVSDAANHASIVDGCRLARADVAIYRHGDADHAAALLAEPGPRRRILVSETVFSMDGDIAPVAELATACARSGALLILDEAHDVGGSWSRAPGSGMHEEVVVLRVATLSKFLGSLGGVVAGPRSFIDLLVNRARSFIFTTATPPGDAAAALAALAIVGSDEGDQLRRDLRAIIDRIAPGHPSPIIPVVIGSEEDAVAASACLGGLGLMVPAIRPPTVAPGTSRLRISVSATHTAEQLDRLESGFDALGLRLLPQ